MIWWHCNRPKAQETLTDHMTIGFSTTSDWQSFEFLDQSQSNERETNEILGYVPP